MTPTKSSARDAGAVGTDVHRRFAGSLVRLRKEQRWSMRCAAGKLGVSPSTWSQWESGKRFPPAHLLDHLRHLFRTTACRLFCIGSVCPHYASSDGKKPSCVVHAS